MADKTITLLLFELIQQLSHIITAQQAHILTVEAYLRAIPGYDADLLAELLRKYQDDPGGAMTREQKLVDSRLQDLLRSFEGLPQ